MEFKMATGRHIAYVGSQDSWKLSQMHSILWQ